MLTAVQPITAGAVLIVVLVEKLSSDIALPFVNTADGSLPKFTTIVLELLDINVPVTAVAVLASPALVRSVNVSPTVKLVSAPTVKE